MAVCKRVVVVRVEGVKGGGGLRGMGGVAIDWVGVGVGVDWVAVGGVAVDWVAVDWVAVDGVAVDGVAVEVSVDRVIICKVKEFEDFKEYQSARRV